MRACAFRLTYGSALADLAIDMLFPSHGRWCLPQVYLSRDILVVTKPTSPELLITFERGLRRPRCEHAIPLPWRVMFAYSRLPLDLSFHIVNVIIPPPCSLSQSQEGGQNKIFSNCDQAYIPRSVWFVDQQSGLRRQVGILEKFSNL